MLGRLPTIYIGILDDSIDWAIRSDLELSYFTSVIVILEEVLEGIQLKPTELYCTYICIKFVGLFPRAY